MIKAQQELEDLRQEMLEADRQDYKHEQLMRSDWEYFCTYTDFEQLKEAFEKVTNDMVTYDWTTDLKELL